MPNEVLHEKQSENRMKLISFIINMELTNSELLRPQQLLPDLSWTQSLFQRAAIQLLKQLPSQTPEI